jgi:peptidoglycan/xylan/chitin deacetylase (PgdA/CDA1 family)
MMFTLTLMMYHYVRDPGDAAEAGSGIPGLPVAQFEAQLDQLARDYDIISWPELRAHLVQNQPLSSRACLLTFDDGLCDHYVNVFPALRRRGLSGLFFSLARSDGSGLALPYRLHYLLARLGPDSLRALLWARLNYEQRLCYAEAEAKYRPEWGDSNLDLLKLVLQRELSEQVMSITTSLLEEYIGPEADVARQLYLSQEQIYQMAAQGMHFGGHSKTHPWFDFVDAARRSREIQASAEWLSGVESGPYAFAYPYGGLADDAPEFLRENGFIAAFTTKPLASQSDPFWIGRFDAEELVYRV